MRKTNSSNFYNEQEILANCPITNFFHQLGGRWKLIILWHLMQSNQRFIDFKKLLPNISDKMLALQLKELQRINLIEKQLIDIQLKGYHYTLTEKGKSIEPILLQIWNWGGDK